MCLKHVDDSWWLALSLDHVKLLNCLRGYWKNWDMSIVYRPSSKGIMSSSGHLVYVKNMQRWSSCAATAAVFSGNRLDILALQIKIQSFRRSWRMWTRAHCMCPYHHKPFWNSSLCDRYFCGLHHYVLSFKQAMRFLLKLI